MPYLGIFGMEFEKVIVKINIKTLELFLKAEFCAKMKVFKYKTKFRTKNALFGLILSWNLKILLLFLKSAPSK